ncbi:hypothetical protein [Actinoplanes aureus]|uniref:Uncharacterized protein n=1 Tax=Actinoplanes aureus TaxID=2792083 RepID=A0A931C7J3_9ACTN|nr:hypothetical protein [Actinoplanes aureus]MBG0564875.1 hypothetical protein [Actinoplanes aureus]
MLIDDDGVAMVGRQWRGFLVHDGSYSPLEPAVHGTDLLIRPDLYEQLLSAVGAHRLATGVVVDCSQQASSPEDIDDDEE